MDIPLRVLALSVLIALAFVGLFLYALELLHPARPLDVKRLESMDKNALIRLLLERQIEGGPAAGKKLFPLALIGSSLLTALLIYVLMKRNPVSAETLGKLMREDERAIVLELARHGGTLRQYELVALVDMNKVRVHRALRELERRGVVEVKTVGRYNIVRLSDDVLELARLLAK